MRGPDAATAIFGGKQQRVVGLPPFYYPFESAALCGDPPQIAPAPLFSFLTSPSPRFTRCILGHVYLYCDCMCAVKVESVAAVVAAAVFAFTAAHYRLVFAGPFVSLSIDGSRIYCYVVVVQHTRALI